MEQAVELQVNLVKKYRLRKKQSVNLENAFQIHALFLVWSSACWNHKRYNKHWTDGRSAQHQPCPDSTTGVEEVIETTGSHFITTNVESFYVQDDSRFTRDLQLNVGLRWDYQQLHDGQSTVLELLGMIAFGPHQPAGPI